MSAVDFQISYLKKVKELMIKEKSSTSFVTAMQKTSLNISRKKSRCCRDCKLNCVK
ncbi:MAG: hypothetical protein PWP16_1937 [Eubacteriaceae bacterium]|nr:hypothetical protein [Eubacteriaceae bacterium]